MNRRVLRVITLSLLAFVALTACAGPGGQAASAAPALVPVTRGDLQATVSGSGTVKPATTANLSFATNGIVKSINTLEGQWVPVGRELAQLDTADLDQQVNQAQANYDRTALQEASLPAKATDTDRKSANANTRASQAQLELAKLNRAKAVLKAPFGGIVTQIGVAVGEATGQRTAFVLQDITTLRAEVSVSENDVGRLRKGQPVVITFDALPGVKVNGMLDYLAPTATTQQNVTTYVVRASLERPPSGVRLGMTANLSAVINERKNVLQLPIDAVRVSGDKQVVVVQQGEGKQRTTSEIPVQTGLSNDTQIEVTSGLSEGQQVLLGATTAQ